MIDFDNSFYKLGQPFYKEVEPDSVVNPQLLLLNKKLLKDLSIEEDDILTQIFSGNKILKGSKPIALAYAGHQFGHFNPALGDGRAVLLGEILNDKNRRFDIQLKGSGTTPFSRSGDGKCPLESAIREYLVSEAMFALGIKTTRSLAVVKGDEMIFRKGMTPSAVITRIASSHIRIGTFEYFLYQNDFESLKKLADYSISRHYPKCAADKMPYLTFFKSVLKGQAKLVASWMGVGFIHGVMNTDNVAISGETLDYGPCAFLDEYDEDKVFSSIDKFGRYAFSNQKNIAMWNLSKLAICLLQLFDDRKIGAELLNKELAKFPKIFDKIYYDLMLKKIGIFKRKKGDEDLLEGFLELLQKYQIDYNLGFKKLSLILEGRESEYLPNKESDFQEWRTSWLSRLEKDDNRSVKMNKINPLFIPRNHLIQNAINKALDGDFSESEKLAKIFKKPFAAQDVDDFYSKPVIDEQRVFETFCGT